MDMQILSGGHSFIGTICVEWLDDWKRVKRDVSRSDLPRAAVSVERRSTCRGAGDGDDDGHGLLPQEGKARHDSRNPRRASGHAHGRRGRHGADVRRPCVRAGAQDAGREDREDAGRGQLQGAEEGLVLLLVQLEQLEEEERQEHREQEREQQRQLNRPHSIPLSYFSS